MKRVRPIDVEEVWTRARWRTRIGTWWAKLARTQRITPEPPTPLHHCGRWPAAHRVVDLPPDVRSRRP